MAKRIGPVESGAAPAQKRPAGKGMGTGRLLGLALICLLVVVAGYLIWMFMSVKGPGIGSQKGEVYWTEERMALSAYRHGFKEDLLALNEKRKREGKAPLPLPKLPPAMERRRR